MDNIDNFDILFIIVGVVIRIFSIIFSIKKNNKLKKLKAGDIESKEIKGIVDSIEYNTDENGSKIISRFFFAKAINPKTQKEEDFKSEDFPYKDSGFKFRFGGPNEEDKKKFFEYARNIVKKGDIVKIHLSEEDSELYYIEDDYVSGKSLDTNRIIENKQFMENNTDIWGINMNGKASRKLKKKIIIMFVAVSVISFVASFSSLKSDNQNSTNLIKLILPKFDWGININRGGSYVVRIILVLIIAFIVYKIISGYKGPKKNCLDRR